MTKQEQDKNWALLSEESKYHYQTEYKNRLEDSKREIEDPEGGGDLTVLTSRYIAEDLEKIFGKHNLQPSLTYQDVTRELFKNGAWQVAGREYPREFVFNEGANEHYFLNCASEEQGQKLLAINKLLNAAKFLNKNEDGSDWVPDFSDPKQKKWYLIIDYNFNKKGKIRIEWKINFQSEIVYFRTDELAHQALRILGEDVVRTALTTKY